MKKIILTILIIALTLSVTACKNTEQSGLDDSDISSVTSLSSKISLALDKNDTEISLDSASKITFTNTSISAENATVNGNVVTISAAGVYEISGECADGQVIVNSQGVVRLIFNNLNLTSKSSAPIFVQSAEKCVITLATNSENTLSDSDTYVLNEDEEPTSAIFSKDDLTINGEGKLLVQANYNNGIQSKDTLKIVSGSISINATDDGLVGKDYVYIVGGEIDITSKGDAIKATKTEDSVKGSVVITDGTLTIQSEKDGIQAENMLVISGGSFDITTFGGSENAPSKSEGNGGMGGIGGGFPTDGERPTRPNQNGDFVPNTGATTSSNTYNIESETLATTTSSSEESRKALKAGVLIDISNGTFSIDSYDDAIHSNDSLIISGGNFALSTGDDAIHSETKNIISGGEIDIEKCYEGIEGESILISGGNIIINASDDGINASSSSSTATTTTQGFPQGGLNGNSNATITISGGYIEVYAKGDGLDSNGSIVQSGGIVISQCTSLGADSAIDYDGSYTMTGGTMVGLSALQMAQSCSSTSSQYSFLTAINGNANDPLTIKNSADKEIYSFTPTVAYQALAFSSSELGKGTFTISNSTTSVTIELTSVSTNQGGGFGGGGFGGKGQKFQ